jgi:hypothetical protein
MTSTGRWGGIDIEPENGPPGRVVVNGLTATHDLDVALLTGWTATLRNIDVADGPINFVVRDRSRLILEDARINSGEGKIEIRTLGRNGRITLRDVDVFGKDITWIQRDGVGNELILERVRNLGHIEEDRRAPPDANRLIRND